MFNFLTIKNRILITFAILCSVAIYYFSNWVSDSSRRHYLESAEELLVDQLIVLKKMVLLNTDENSESPDLKMITQLFSVDNEKHPEAVIYEISKSSSDINAYITDKEGTVLFHSLDSNYIGQSFLKWRNIHLALDGKYGARSTRDDQEDPTTSNLHVTHPLVINDRLIGTLTLIKPVKRISQYLELSRERVTRIAVLTLILILLLGFLLMRRIVNPIEELTKYTEKISDGERPERPKLPKGELTILGQTIEEMTRNLDGKAYVESYIQGVTHELKSPIAAIKGAAELIETDKLSDDEKKLFQNINLESDRMSEMVQKLLLLSRIENQSFSENQEEVELKSLINEVIDEASERYPGREFEFENCSELKFKADKLLLKTALSNLVSNACEFSKGKIDIDLKQAIKKIEISVKDSGSGIPDYAVGKVFDRFYSLPRPEKGVKSSGLGLSIVKEIAQLHKGEIQLSNRGDGQSGVIAILKLKN